MQGWAGVRRAPQTPWMGGVQDGTARPGLPGNSPSAFPREDKHSSENLHEARRLLPRGSQHRAHPLVSLGQVPLPFVKGGAQLGSIRASGDNPHPDLVLVNDVWVLQADWEGAGGSGGRQGCPP